MPHVCKEKEEQIRHSNPQIVLGLLVSADGCPLAYSIHEGNRYEGHTMLPVVTDFVRRYRLEDFVIVADSGMMSDANVRDLEANGYQYVVGARIKNMSSQTRICICFVALKVYRELGRLLKANNIGLSVDAVLNIAKTIPNVTVNLSGNAFSKTLFLTDRHKQIQPLFFVGFCIRVFKTKHTFGRGST